MLGILRKNFAPKKSRPRKWPAVSMIHRDFDPLDDDEYGLDVGPIVLRLGSISVTFVHGRWVTEDAGGAGPSEAGAVGGAELAEENQVLREENNMLKLKVELLLDMLADAGTDATRAADADDQWEQQPPRGYRQRRNYGGYD